MQYEIWLDFVNYRTYTGNIDKELTNFIFNARVDDSCPEIPKEWENKLLPFPHDEYGLVLCDIGGKKYSSEEVQKYNLKDKSLKEGPFRIFWKFELPSDKVAKKTAEFMIKKSQEYMKTEPKPLTSRKKFTDNKEIPIEIYRLEKILVP